MLKKARRLLLFLEKEPQLMLVVGASFASILFILLVLHALSASPIADDWTFFVSYRENSLVDFIDSCMHHTGRIAQWLVIYLGYAIFGMAAVKVMPVIFLTLFSLLLGLLVYKFMRPVSIYGIIGSWSIGVTVACVTVLCMPSIHDSFLWYDSAASYMTSLVFLVAGVYVIYAAIIHKLTILRLSGLVGVLILGQLASEPTSVWMIGASIVGLVVAISMKHMKSIRVLSVSALSLLIGFAILYFSPGSITRRSTSPDWILSESLVDALAGYGTMFSEWGVWLLLVPPLILLVMLLIDQTRNKVSPLAAALIGVGIFLTTTYPVFLLSEISQDYLPYRVFTLPTFGTVVSFGFLVISLRGMLKSYSDALYKPTIIAAIVLVGIGSLGMAYISSNNIEKLAIRDRVVKLRDSQVVAQIEDDVDIYTIMRAPLLLPGNAEDFYYNDAEWNKNGRIWVLNTYLTYMGIDENLPKDKVVIAEPLDLYW